MNLVQINMIQTSSSECKVRKIRKTWFALVYLLSQMLFGMFQFIRAKLVHSKSQCFCKERTRLPSWLTRTTKACNECQQFKCDDFSTSFSKRGWEKLRRPSTVNDLSRLNLERSQSIMPKPPSLGDLLAHDSSPQSKSPIIEAIFRGDSTDASPTGQMRGTRLSSSVHKSPSAHSMSDMQLPPIMERPSEAKHSDAGPSESSTVAKDDA